MKNKYGIILATSLFAATPVLTGCQALGGVLPIISNIIKYTGAGVEALDKVQEAVDAYFTVNPDPDKQKKFARAMSLARNALKVVLKASEGAENASRQDVDAARKDFESAYSALITTLTDLGFGVNAGGDALSAAQGDQPTVEVLAPGELTKIRAAGQ